MFWTSSSGKIQIQMTPAQAQLGSHQVGSHQGWCDKCIFVLRQVPAIRRQLDKLDPATVASELKEYGAWDELELLDHQQNLNRLLWIAAGDIAEGE